MIWIVKNLWLIPALPILAAGLSALAPQRCRKFSATLAIGSINSPAAGEINSAKSVREMFSRDTTSRATAGDVSRDRRTSDSSGSELKWATKLTMRMLPQAGWQGTREFLRNAHQKFALRIFCGTLRAQVGQTD